MTKSKFNQWLFISIASAFAIAFMFIPDVHSLVKACFFIAAVIIGMLARKQ